MSTVVNCPTCGAKAKIKEKEGNTTYTGLTYEELGTKIKQLKAALRKFKEKAEGLEKELAAIKNH